MPGGSAGILLEGVVGRHRPGAARVRFRHWSGEARLGQEGAPMLFREPISRETGLSADGPAFVMRARPAQTAAFRRPANGSVPARPARGGTSGVLASSQAYVFRFVRGRPASRSSIEPPSRRAFGLRRNGRRRSEGAAWGFRLREGVTRRCFSALVTTERSQEGNLLRKKGLYGLRPSPECSKSGDTSACCLLFPRCGYVPAGTCRDSVAAPRGRCSRWL